MAYARLRAGPEPRVGKFRTGISRILPATPQRDWLIGGGTSSTSGRPPPAGRSLGAGQSSIPPPPSPPGGTSSTSRRSRNHIGRSRIGETNDTSPQSFVGLPRRLVRHSFSDGGSQAKAGHFVEVEESSRQGKILGFSYTSPSLPAPRNAPSDGHRACMACEATRTKAPIQR